MGIAAAWDESLAERAAEITGREGRALGFHWNFAPDADVNSNPRNPVIGVRTFSDDSDMVTRLTLAQLRGYARGGMLSCPKHFPGHGDAGVDSHLGLPTIACPPEEFREIHLAPFLAAIEAGAPTLMTAHIMVPWLDPELPATLSRRILTDLLRGELGYRGLVITDQMTMKSVATRWGAVEGSVLAFAAGSDVVLAGGDTDLQVATILALRAAAESGAIGIEQLDASVRRVLELKEALGLFSDAMVEVRNASATASAEGEALSDELAERSITLVRNEGVLPFDPSAPGVTFVAGMTNESIFGPTRATHVARIAHEIENVSAGSTLAWAASGENPTNEEIDEALSLASSADRIVVLSYARGTLPPGQIALVRRLADSGKPMAAVAMGTPYDLMAYPEVPAYVAAFVQSFVPIHITAPHVVRALVRVLFGGAPRGRLPVHIPGLYPLGHGLDY
jgi:beta-N-acetylhexosaminidase